MNSRVGESVGSDHSPSGNFAFPDGFYDGIDTRRYSLGFTRHCSTPRARCTPLGFAMRGRHEPQPASEPVVLWAHTADDALPGDSRNALAIAQRIRTPDYDRTPPSGATMSTR